MSTTASNHQSCIVDTTDGKTGVTVTGSNALKVDGSAVTQPVSGTVTSNIGTTNGLALDATLTGGTQKTKLIDTGGTNVAGVGSNGALSIQGVAGGTAVPISSGATLTTQGAVSGQGNTAMAVGPVVPTSGNILGGSTASTSSGTTIITIPQNRTWCGVVGVSFDTTTAAGNITATVQTSGTNVVPAAGTVVCGNVQVQQPTTATNGGGATVCQNVYVQAPAGNSVTLVTNWGTAPAAAVAWANGVLL